MSRGFLGWLTGVGFAIRYTVRHRRPGWMPERNPFPKEAVMSELRTRMVNAMVLRRFSPRTRESYVGAVRGLAA